jgi:prolyl-tRNA synthetase
VQGPDFHHDGQHYSRAYGIKFLNKDGKEEYSYQNTFAISTRMLGVLFAVHSDSKGLILPPKIASNKVVIVPIIFEDSKEKVLKKAKEIEKELKDFDAMLDDREEYKPGYKFNEWEMRGIPLRIEIGPKDLAENKVVITRRDNGKKETVKFSDVKKEVSKLLEEIQESMYKKAEKMLRDNLVKVEDLKDLKFAIKEKKIALAPLCGGRECEDMLKFESGGAKVLNIPFEQPKDLDKAKCILCDEKAEYFAHVGKSY